MTSLVEAIQHKFDMLIDPGKDMQHVILYGSPSAWRKRFSTASGDLRLPNALVMDNSNVATLGDLDRLSSMCGHVVELDLANNRLTDWSELLKLLSRLPRLRSLNLSINPLLGSVINAEQPVDSDSPTHGEEKTDEPEKASSGVDGALLAPPMPHLATLALNQVPNVTWPMLAGLLSSAPNLVELYLCNNGLGAPEFPCPQPGGYPNVQQLYFNGNRLMPLDWQRLAEWFPKLEKLTLIGNASNELPSNCDAAGGGKFPLLSDLKSLNLSESGVNCWAELEKLNQCPELTDLRILDIELAKSRSKKDFRSEAIARLAHVTQLNGAPLTEDERTSAERALIRAHTVDLTEPKSDAASSSHPNQLSSLLAKHGKLESLAKVDLRPSQTVNLVLRYGSQSRTCQLATNQLVRDVRREVCAQFGLEASAKVGLYYIDQGMVGAMGPEELNLLGRAFHSYRPEDGDELVLKDRV